MEYTEMDLPPRLRRREMNEEVLLKAFRKLLTSRGKPGKAELTRLLSQELQKRKLVKDVLNYIAKEKLLHYLPNLCGLGYSLLLVGYESSEEKRSVESEKEIRPLIELKPAVDTPFLYSVYSVPTLLILDLYREITSLGVNAYLQSGYHECLSLDARRKGDLLRFAQLLAASPFLSIRKISAELGTAYSTGKFFYGELEKKGFFEGRFIINKSRIGYIQQHFFLVKKGYEEPEDISGISISYISSFSHRDDVIKLGVAVIGDAENFFARVASLLCKYDIYISNLFSIPH